MPTGHSRFSRPEPATPPTPVRSRTPIPEARRGRRECPIDVDDVVPVGRLQAAQPLLQQVRLRTVLPAQPLDPEPDLADGQGTE